MAHEKLFLFVNFIFYLLVEVWGRGVICEIGFLRVVCRRFIERFKIRMCFLCSIPELQLMSNMVDEYWLIQLYFLHCLLWTFLMTWTIFLHGIKRKIFLKSVRCWPLKTWNDFFKCCLTLSARKNGY